MMDEPIITMRDMYRAGYCVSGTRAFFERHGLNFKLFARYGISAATLRATGDAMAEHAIRATHGRK